MSSILKALEKAEESQNIRRSGGGSVFVPARKRRPVWVIPAGVVGGAVVASLVTFAAMGGLSRPAPPAALLQAALKPAAVAEPAPVTVVPSYQVVEEPAFRPDQTLDRQPAEAVAVPAQVVAVPPRAVAVPPRAVAVPTRAVAVPPRAVAVPTRAVAVPTKVVAVPAKAAPAPARRSAAKARPQPALPLRSIPVVQPSAAEIAAARLKSGFAAVPPSRAQATAQRGRQDIRVTGIAWQKDGASSAAIVNGRTLKQGATVDGYKVEQIFENHVTFSGSNGKLQVPLGGGE